MANTSRKLSSDEVSALMEGLKSGEINAGEGLNTDLEVSSFTFGSDNLELLGDYYALRLINERFARLVRSIFLPNILVVRELRSSAAMYLFGGFRFLEFCCCVPCAIISSYDPMNLFL